MANKEIAALQRKAERAGWSVMPTKSGHVRWRAPDGTLVHSPSTPGRGRAIGNLRSMLKRYGLEI